MKLTTDQLTIYLHDHHAGATAGVALAGRLRDHHAGTAHEAPLAKLAAEIAADRDELVAIMDQLGAGRDELKVAVAWAAERAGRLKPNGRLRGYAASRVIEIEALRGGVHAKLGLWQALGAVAGEHPQLLAADLARLEHRAELQLDVLRQHHRRAALAAFSATRS